MVGKSWTRRVVVGLAVGSTLLVSACTDDSEPADPRNEADTSTDAGATSGGDGFAQALGLVGTQGLEWEVAAGYWADTDHLMGMVGDGDRTGAPEGVRQVENLALYAAPQVLLLPAREEADQEWFDVASAQLRDTDWGLRLNRMGAAPMTYWHDSPAWEALEPALSGSDSWDVTDAGATYAGPQQIWRDQLAVSPTAERDVVWQTRDSAWRDIVGISPTLAEVVSPGMLECLAGAHAVAFQIAPTDGTLGDWDGTAYAMAVAVDDPALPTAWWCGSLPGEAQELAANGGPAPSDLGVPQASPGAALALDEDTVKVTLEPTDGAPASTVGNAILGFPEKTFPGY